ncbi:cytochrome c3 family protein [Bacillus sp. FJAT-29814]|uniref:multiheme c-type cytochrome n=1 Tax=Bacillus sp. FJAT-29814 TaxID=1729688 RepID=UPI000834521E|nr:cytochrome c3 family protein [Bacillus sp. FJAT-29814]
MKQNIGYFNKVFPAFLILLLVCSSVFAIPKIQVNAAIGDPPTIKINSPVNNEVLHTKEIVFQGTYSDDNVSMEQLLFTAYDNDTAFSDSSLVGDNLKGDKWEIIDNGTDKTWTFSTSRLTEGNHNISIEIKENIPDAGAMIDKESVTITIGPLDTVRPIITKSGIELPDKTFLIGEDFTRVPLEAKIKITVSDDYPMTNLVNKINLTSAPYNPIIVMFGANQVSGTTKINDLGKQNDNNYLYEILFTPDDPVYWKLNSTYKVYIDPDLLDDVKNPIYTKTFKFTTKSEMSESDNPHGHYLANTNMCAACHSSHEGGSDSTLNGVSYKDRFKGELQADPSSNYCMACHDGTMNAPMIDQIDKTYHHNNPADYSGGGINELKNAESCTSCHNPHTGWSEENPNLLKDHFVYKHEKLVPERGLNTLTIDSLETSCIECHEDNSIYDTNKYPNVIKEVFSYKKSITAEGTLTNNIITPTTKTISDYSLCLRCHNTEKNKNIESYYIKSNSGHFLVSEGNQPNLDGSYLKGAIPCAECHDTHGSNNIKLLREKFGNVKTEQTFNKSSGAWLPSEERDFCLKCHNNSIEMYGRIAQFKELNAIGNIIEGHRLVEDKDTSCSSCHGGESKSLIEAAHAPVKLP